ncbi:dipeptide ABC transporter ATP-binding protein [Kordiimonas pumila]|uniref:Dipeptide ABC transporter ATP-binding protein n=1 Tax=Kordiimonas pumila TaxID=2161677 RepID=A0ABV7D4J0_9PROT|nr:ABC transporter ATP-binding protein [Kordiimonas pumila]
MTDVMTAPDTIAKETAEPLLRFEGLSIRFGSADYGVSVVKGFSASLHAGKILALVGESGSGKTMVSRAVLRLLPPGGHISGGRILFKGKDLAALSAREMQDVRGVSIGMVFQEPMTSLNPTLTVGFQMAEALKWHFNLPDGECRERSIAMLKRVRITDPETCLAKFPHEFSGGMRQRILLASVLLMKPAVLIADEPTTALDVLAQKQVMDIMCEIVHELGVAVLLITHDLGLVAQYADQVAVIKKGDLIEMGSISDTLLAPKHAYTQSLMGALPVRYTDIKAEVKTPPLCEIKGVSVAYRGRRQWPWQAQPVHKVLHDVSLDLRQGETFVVVGESGSGKTTLARTMLGLIRPDSGSVIYNGTDIGTLDKSAFLVLRQKMQMVFQDPYSALDPRMFVGATIAEGLRHESNMTRAKVRAATLDILREVGLDESYYDRFPHELSGGQRQRVNIARALVSQPDFVVADEPVSALDITVQEEILELFKALQQRHKFACLFITHDLSVAEQVGDRIAVMYQGKLVEAGTRDQVFDDPRHPYTCALLEAAPRLVKSRGDSYELISLKEQNPRPPEGFMFGGWHPELAVTRSVGEATLHDVGAGHLVAFQALSEKERNV